MFSHQLTCDADGMNDLQHISMKKFGPVLVTLNAPFEPDASKTVGKYNYDHPVLDHKVNDIHLAFSSCYSSLDYLRRWNLKSG